MPENVPLDIAGGVVANNVTDTKFVKYANAVSPIDFRLVPSVMFSNEVQLLKASESIKVTEFGIVKFFKAAQPEKLNDPISANVCGNVIVSIKDQFEKEKLPILVTGQSMINDFALF